MTSKNTVANKALPLELYPAGHDPDRAINQSSYRFTISRTKDLNNDDKARIWDIFEENMKDLYETSSWGWKPSPKRKELFHSRSRFILVRPLEADGTSSSPIVAYAIFRFDQEENMDDEMEDVLYCYEVQVSTGVQRSGLGKALFEDMEVIAKKWGMKKVMLTALNANTQATSFYEKIGFTMDPVSPSCVQQWRKGKEPVSSKGNGPEAQDEDDEWQDEEFDYEIYSKVVQ